MGLINNIYLLQSFHSLVIHKITGPPKEFAKKLGISERKLYRLIDELRDNGANIVYNSKKYSYQYNNRVDINIVVKIAD